jgi:tetratricopeptide (TPR) repeat protein
VTGLRALWDFGDLDASERRFEERLGEERDAAARAEILTQLARVHSLRGAFGRCATLLDEADALAGADPVVRPWIQIERGRMHNSAGEVDAARPLFDRAYEGALAAAEFFLAGDAAHMAAIAAPDLAGEESWTARGLELGEREPDAAYWAGPLLNNLGWTYSDAGDHERALGLFERALAARRRDADNAAGIAWAEYAVGYTLRRLGREDDARPLLERAAAALPHEPEVAEELGAVSS